ncbi:MAG: hypothetical protein IJU48_01735 [Synergistaceae bacterium]|nr:hypothetical protein [Synergistaceae bacterium]
MIVVKFSGSAVANAEKLKTAAKIINSETSCRYVVVSSPGKNLPDDIKITDMLYILHSKFQSREGYNEMLKKIAEQFMSIILELGITFDIDREIAILKEDLLAGESADYIASRGEFIMAKIFAKMLNWEFVDAAKIIFFDADGKLEDARTFATASEVLSKYEHAVIPGFYGSLPNGKIKTFPRGGGDITGAIIARAVKADLFEKCTANTNFFSADPSIVSEPKIIQTLTYSEALEINYTGIKIIHDEAAFLLKDTEIPTKVRNINTPSSEGTLITPTKDLTGNITVCIAGRRNFNIIHIEKFGINRFYGFGEKLFGIFARYNAPCEHCLSGIHKISVVVKTPMFDLKRNEILREIESIIQPDSLSLERDLSIILTIGEGTGRTYGILDKIASSLAHEKINIRMLDQGSDDLNVILGVSDKDYDAAIRTLYHAMIV